MLDSLIEQRLIEARDKLSISGRLPHPDAFDRYLALFRQHFGPAVLANLDGEALLALLHDRSTKHNLMYWLEFKNDEEFPDLFGGIGGGSALKFGIYQQKETGAWITGAPAQRRELQFSEAIDIARRQREQLLACVSILDQFPVTDEDEAYQSLQHQLNQAGPDVSNTGWGHKYLSLLFPEKLDLYHNADWQRFHLMRMLMVPPEGPGRYLVTGRFQAIAHQLGVTLPHVFYITYEAHGMPYQYWRVGTTDDQGNSYWEMMQHEEVMAIGWPLLGDLTGLPYEKAAKEHLKSLVTQHYPNTPSAVGRTTQQIFNFLHKVSSGDLVMAADGMQVLGIGRVRGEYEYRSDCPFPNCRQVEWMAPGFDRLPEAREGLMTTLYALSKPANIIDLERRLLTPSGPELPKPPQEHILPRLTGFPARIEAILKRKGQVILYGPPGTGKTHWAEWTACELAARGKYRRSFSQLSKEEQDDLRRRHVTLCTFHPGYGYEEFIEGYRPELMDGRMVFLRRDGLFKQLCASAKAESSLPFYLIIDEINRGDIPRIFGELLTVMEKNKRGTPVILPLSGESFSVPENVYLIGTMNTADRSIALLDAALRRRFGFLELLPDPTVFGTATIEDLPLGRWLMELNRAVRTHVGRDARNLQIGHAYLLDRHGKPITEMATLARVIREDIIPLLEEYCYEDYGALADILGSSVVNREGQYIQEELFQPDRFDELRRALIAPFAAEITTSAEALASDAEVDEEPVEASEDNATSLTLDGETGA